MSKLFRNSSPGALTLQQSIELEKKRMAESKNQKGTGHGVDDEPRVPKGNGRESGEWTRDGGPSADGTRATATASSDGQTVTITQPDGKTEVRKDGSLTWRTNNPGAILVTARFAGSFAERHGAIGLNGTMAIFPDEATGEAASRALLNGPKYSGLTVDGAVSGRTPDKIDGNNTTQTQKLVRQFSGLPGDAIIGQLSPEEKERLYHAIRRSEGWRSGNISRGTPMS